MFFGDVSRDTFPIIRQGVCVWYLCVGRRSKHFKVVYVGETKRTLNIRAEEYITAIKSASKRSHTAEHCWEYNHHFDWEHKKVLDFEKNWKTRTIKEAIYSEEN